MWVAFALYGEITETIGLKALVLARLLYLMSKYVAHFWIQGEGWFPFEF